MARPCEATLMLNGRTLKLQCDSQHTTRTDNLGRYVVQHHAIMHGIGIDLAKKGTKDSIVDVEMRWDK